MKNVFAIIGLLITNCCRGNARSAVLRYPSQPSLCLGGENASTRPYVRASRIQATFRLRACTLRELRRRPPARFSLRVVNLGDLLTSMLAILDTLVEHLRRSTSSST